ncbi:MAG: putative peptidase [Verrucomicrobia subdivision 3 bacterium]|nr:putative peptidase [Limisphaerales bacterium]MCS1412750.1 putative peptidase [Limisphaerales bacterium]
MIADSERDADMLYATGLFVPSPFIYLQKNSQVHLVLSDLEIDRATKHCPDATIHSYSELLARALQDGIRRPNLGHLAALLLRKLRMKRVKVSMTFPHALAETIKKIEPSARLATGQLFPQRAVKTPSECRKIKQILNITQEGLRAGISLIRKAKIKKDGKLYLENHPLTSEYVRSAIHTQISARGGIPCNTIVAGGNQACDPHERGHGPLKANQPIIVDVFPRSESTGYFGDITRTVVKGRASEALRRIYHSVAQAQQKAMDLLRAGVRAQKVHLGVEQIFKTHGFETSQHQGHMQGFFHGTGHGLGLDIHEAPSVGQTSSDTLKAGNVVTVEPGLYYPGTGGVRIEDVVIVGNRRPRKLTDFEQVLEL